MTRHIASIALGALLFALPPAASADTISDLTLQIQTLLAQIQTLQAGQSQSSTVAAPTGISASPCVSISHTLSYESTDEGTDGDVSRLQQFLAHPPAGGPDIYPEGLVTGFFGRLTERAVQRYQQKYDIVSSGDAASTGFGVVGPRTRAVIARDCAKVQVQASTLSLFVTAVPRTPVPAGEVQSWTVQESSAIPNVLFSADWGDGQFSPPQIAPRLSHAYQRAGAYTPLFSATVRGASVSVRAPAITVYESAEANAPTVLYATPAAGTVPLAVTFRVVAPSGWSGSLAAGDGTALSFIVESCTQTLPTICTFAASYAYTNTGTYIATLRLADGSLGPTVTIVVSAQPPPDLAAATSSGTGSGTATSTIPAYLIAVPTAGTAPLAVTFAWTSQNGNMLDFNDGQSISVAAYGTRVHTYGSAGSYAAALLYDPPCRQASPPCGAPSRLLATTTITVTNEM